MASGGRSVKISNLTVGSRRMQMNIPTKASAMFVARLVACGGAMLLRGGGDARPVVSASVVVRTIKDGQPVALRCLCSRCLLYFLSIVT